MLRALLLLTFLGACGGEETGDGEPSPPTVQDDYDPDLIAARPFGLKVPAGYAGEPTPLVVALHGLGWTGLGHAQAMELFPAADAHGFLLAYPDGTVTVAGLGWNASCCGSFDVDADDVHYLRALVVDVKQRYNVDPAQVYVQGLSNGAFMAYLLACEAADIFAAIAPLGGTMWVNELGACQPSAPVAVMHTHGTEDGTVQYGGGNFWSLADYIGAVATIDLWRDRNGCSGAAASSTADVDSGLAGEETAVERWSACGAPVELWTVQGGQHVPALTTSYIDQTIQFLYANRR